jgi:hypothetical protein
MKKPTKQESHWMRNNLLIANSAALGRHTGTYDSCLTLINS